MYINECPKCHKGTIFMSFGVKDNWRIYCDRCGTTTESHKTREDTEHEWNKMHEEEIKDENSR